MLIQEAIKRAMECKGFFYRKSLFDGQVLFWPHHHRMPISAFCSDGRFARNWNPPPEDILAEDWEVTTELGMPMPPDAEAMLKRHP